MLKFIQIKPEDNVAIVVDETKAGTELLEGIVAKTDIPQGHKFALKNIRKNEAIIRYGVIIAYANIDILKGCWIKEEDLLLPKAPSLFDMPYATNIDKELPKASRKSWLGFKNSKGKYAGTRNILGIQTTVQCVQGVLDVALEKIRQELLPKFPNVDDVVAINHAYGCGVAINAEEAKIPIRTLQNICHHPNFGGELMVIALGCEKLTAEMLVGEENHTSENIIVLQDNKGFSANINAIIAMAEKKLINLNKRKREELPLSELLIGMQCGGSDAFSGLTANSAAGFAADLLVEAGATVLFSEVTEVRDGAHIIAERCVSKSVRDRLAEEMNWYDNYLEKANVDRSANPTPGNKKGGLSNIVEKAMGSIAKSGRANIVEVLSPAEKPTKQGMIFAATPASDIVCGPCQFASGIGLQVFMTGRGTPYGLSAIPVLKVSSRNEIYEQWPDLIDLNAGQIATGQKNIEQVGNELFNMIIDVASGNEKTWTERHRLHNYMCIFNPAPIT